MTDGVLNQLESFLKTSAARGTTGAASSVKKESPGVAGIRSAISKAKAPLTSTPGAGYVLTAAKLAGSLEGAVPPGLLLPSSFYLTQGYHPGHTAFDIAGPQGSPFYAPVEMQIIESGPGVWGLDVIGLNPSTGEKYIFGHLEKTNPALIPGMTISPGTLLGYEGSTFNPAAGGYSTGPHLHFEIKSKSGAPVMPGSDLIAAIFGGSYTLLNSTLPDTSRAAVSTFQTSVLSGGKAKTKEGTYTTAPILAPGIVQVMNPAPSPVKDIVSSSVGLKESPAVAAIRGRSAGVAGSTNTPESVAGSDFASRLIAGIPVLKSIASRSAADYLFIISGYGLVIIGLIMFTVQSFRKNGG